jgi:uncharacterized membrane protein YhhN
MTPALAFWIGLAVAVIYFPMSDRPASWPRSLVKTVPLVAFAAAAWGSGAPLWLVAGLILSAIGDFALSRRGDLAFLSGLGAFALAHVAYVVVFLGLSERPIWDAFVLAPLLALFLVAVTGSTEIWLAPHTNGLRWPVRIYAMVITLMGLAALTLPIGQATLGMTLFITSDVLLAMQLFRMGEDNPLVARTSWTIWGLYIAGQALILTGTVAL